MRKTHQSDFIIIALPSPTLSVRLIALPDLIPFPGRPSSWTTCTSNTNTRARQLKLLHALRLGALLAAINVYESRQARDGQELMSAPRAQDVPGPASEEHHPSIYACQGVQGPNDL
jgi:hypothetical protein